MSIADPLISDDHLDQLRRYHAEIDPDVALLISEVDRLKAENVALRNALQARDQIGACGKIASEARQCW